MTAFARVITVGRNNEMPRVVKVPVGVHVDGTVAYYRMRLEPDEIVCPECHGVGEVEYSSVNPSVKPWSERCERCKGHGLVNIEQESAAGSGCHSPAADGRAACAIPLARPTPSGMTPDAPAASVSRQLVPSRTPHTVLRRCSDLPQASQRPTSIKSPDMASGALEARILDAATVLAGLVVFGAAAFFFMVLA